MNANWLIQPIQIKCLLQFTGTNLAEEVFVDIARGLVIECGLRTDVGGISIGVIDGIYSLRNGVTFALNEHLDEVGGDIFDHKAKLLRSDVHCHSLWSFEMARWVQKAYW